MKKAFKVILNLVFLTCCCYAHIREETAPVFYKQILTFLQTECIFFSRGTYDVVHTEVVGGLESFHLKVMHFIAAKRADLTNLRLIPLHLSSNELSPNKISLGSLSILVPTTVPIISKTPSQYTSRSGQDHNMCKSVPLWRCRVQ